MRNDFNIRFRPLYYFHRVLEIRLLGVDFFRLSLYTGLLASLSVSFLYLAARKLRHSIFEALLFVCLALIGSQAAIWWRLGPAETIGVFSLAVAFLFLARCTEDDNNYKVNNVLFISLLIIASLSKESFVISIPAFVVFKIWNEKEASNLTAKESLKKNKLALLPLIVMVIELLIIKFVIGTNEIGYAGATSSINEFITGVENIVFGPLSLLNWVKLLGALMSP